ncbi:hypothetical protein ACFW3Z_25615 [Nocardiopsis alba]|uniref:hypothetical protein n=1 Tax=Nocardiopsis alba TaxID=53437 RepID=UPI0036707255
MATELITQVAEVSGASRDDVVRVATSGGTSAADWAIAYAIEAITGRPAVDIMWAAQDRLPEPPAVAPTNPHAQHDPEVRIYPEHTSPEESREVIAHHPGDHDEDDLDDQDDELAAAEALAVEVHADLAHILDDTTAAARLTAAWSTPTEGRALLAEVLSLHGTPTLRAEVLAAQVTADLAA